MTSCCALNHLATIQMSGAEDARLDAGPKKVSELSVTEEEHTRCPVAALASRLMVANASCSPFPLQQP